MVNTISFRRGKLPHWMVADHAYFVTITQNGCIPGYCLKEISDNAGDASDQFLAIDNLLDNNSESFRVLTPGIIADDIMSAFSWLESSDRGWMLHAVCIMPSHIHIVMRNLNGRSGCLEKDIAAFKNFTARLCNSHLGRSGRFWAKESFDHWCRDEVSVRKSIAYTLRNPVRAGLVAKVEDWPWSKVGDEYIDYIKTM